MSRREIRRRAAIAHTALGAHRKLLYQIYQNGSLPWSKRKELFLTLVMSKFVYGMSSWLVTDQRSKDFLHATIVKLYRRLFKVPHDRHMNDAEVLSRTQLPCPSSLLRRERPRYLGQLYNCKDTACWSLLHLDEDWMSLLRADTHWMWCQLCHASPLQDPAHHWPQ